MHTMYESQGRTIWPVLLRAPGESYFAPERHVSHLQTSTVTLQDLRTFVFFFCRGLTACFRCANCAAGTSRTWCWTRAWSTCPSTLVASTSWSWVAPRWTTSASTSSGRSTRSAAKKSRPYSTSNVSCSVLLINLAAGPSREIFLAQGHRSWGVGWKYVGVRVCVDL